MEVELLKKYGSVSPGKIENLDGTTETVDFRFSTAIRFYHNMEDADFPLHWHHHFTTVTFSVSCQQKS